MKASYIAAVFVIMAILVAEEAHVSMAATCNPAQLSPCMSAISSASPPSRLCCTRIRQQRPCLCQYLRNPNLKKYINTPNARKVARTCGTPIPRC